MLNMHIKASADLRYNESADIDLIVHEVKRHGFYSARCANLVLNARDQQELIEKIQSMAASAMLLVSFNATYELCIFEAAS